MTTLKWSDTYYQHLKYGTHAKYPHAMYIGTEHIPEREDIRFDNYDYDISLMSLTNHIRLISDLTLGSCHPQLAYLVFAITRRPQFLESYFPLVKHLNANERLHFHETVQHVLLHPGFDFKVVRKNSANQEIDLTRMVQGIGYLVAGHIAELFFYRQDILDTLLKSGIHIWLYTDAEAYKAAGGVAGGCYNTQNDCIQLVVSRLFEGFNQPTPGVAPFLHEFGHLLDFYDAGSLKATNKSSGWLPGMRVSDGAIYTPEAREAFIKGKRVEIERYERQIVNPDGKDPLPIGHPYVFQNNSEFIAGYPEMFFRNPHSFAAQNSDLFQGFAVLFKQDPRRYWEKDFLFYVEQNRAFYQSGQRPRPHGLTLD